MCTHLTSQADPRPRVYSLGEHVRYGAAGVSVCVCLSVCTSVCVPSAALVSRHAGAKEEAL